MVRAGMNVQVRVCNEWQVPLALLGKAPAIRPASRGPCEPHRACTSMRRTIAAQALAQTGGIPAVIKRRGRGRPANAQGTAAGAASLSCCQGLVSGIASLRTYRARHVATGLSACHRLSLRPCPAGHIMQRRRKNWGRSSASIALGHRHSEASQWSS
jgi:hypothetical protein